MQTAMGTLSIMPGIPQTRPQNARDSTMATGWSSRALPKIFGSRKLPHTMWVAHGKARARIFVPAPKEESRSTRGMGRRVAMMLPR